MDDGKKSNSRPRLLRALGTQDPPAEIVINEASYQLQEVIKHDSWAATALYQSNSGKVVCKFNRVEPILGLPMRWLGRWLARRERSMYLRLNDLENIPTGYSQVIAAGEELHNAAAHQYINGSPLRWHHRLDQQFFHELRSTIDEMHSKRIAIVDLNKKENIIVGEDNRPYLIDFQISVKLPRLPFFSALLRILQQSDRYHLDKHLHYLRPDLLCGFSAGDYELKRPVWIQLHRKVAIPFRQLRRRLLVSLNVRKGDGKVHSEQFVESGLRPISSNTDPLLALYELVTSQEYYKFSGPDIDSYIGRLFHDLLGRKMDSQDQGLLDVLGDGRSRGEVAMHLLRAPVLFKISDCLSDEWLRKQESNIRTRLDSDSENEQPRAKHAA